MTTAPTLRGGGGGALLIISATAIAGVAGYAVTFLVFHFLGPADYRGFAVFWAALNPPVMIKPRPARAERLNSGGRRRRRSFCRREP